MGNISEGPAVFSGGAMGELRKRIYDKSKPPLPKCKVCFAHYSGRD
jgi:hypothetical protein